MPILYFFSIFVFLFTADLSLAANYSVSGRLICNGNPYTEAKILIMEHDTISADDKLAETVADSDGNFEISGPQDGEKFFEEPYLLVKHKCHQTNQMALIKGCHFKSELGLKQKVEEVQKVGTLYLDGLAHDDMPVPLKTQRSCWAW